MYTSLYLAHGRDLFSDLTPLIRPLKLGAGGRREIGVTREKPLLIENVLGEAGVIISKKEVETSSD
jgi:hypothetical protein